MTTHEPGPESDGGTRYADFRNLLRGSAFIFDCRLAGAVATFLTQVFLARWMGATELGFYVLAFAWCLLLSTLAAIGLQVGAVRFIGVAAQKNEPEVIRGFVYRAVQITLGFGSLLALVGIFSLLSFDRLVDAMSVVGEYWLQIVKLPGRDTRIA